MQCFALNERFYERNCYFLIDCAFFNLNIHEMFINPQANKHYKLRTTNPSSSLSSNIEICLIFIINYSLSPRIIVVVGGKEEDNDYQQPSF